MTADDNHLRLVISRETHASPIRGLYLVTDEAPLLAERVKDALAGGASVVQYRDKNSDRSRKRALGRELRDLCRRYGVPFIVNDDLALARELDADGVHLGQEDGSVAEARQTLAPGRLVGISAHNLEEALRAQDAGADYIGFGAMYATASKTVIHMPGPAALAAVRRRVSLPVVAIGGIHRDNAAPVIDAGADAVAVISAVLAAPRPALAAAELRLLFNRTLPWPRGAVLTVAGSDSGGGAGIQADLTTNTLLGSYGASALTALTAQNTRGVQAIHGLPPSFVREQLEAVLSDLPIDVIKTGMLHTPAIISLLAEFLSGQPRVLATVIDPVMVAKGGAQLLEREAVSAFTAELLPQAYLVTPNLPEAERLLSRRIQSEADMEAAARELHALGAANVLLKGGHLAGSDAVDLLFDGTTLHRFGSERIFTSATHGTGCTFASAIAALLAQGEPLPTAVGRAKQFITAAIRHAHPMGKGHGPVNHFLAAQQTVKGEE